jgi:hypothetical protein
MLHRVHGTLFLLTWIAAAVQPQFAHGSANKLQTKTPRLQPGSGLPQESPTSRYSQPPLWLNVSRIHIPTLAESRHRALHSPIRVHQGDGLGHGMATKNIEVTAAIRLGVTYTHRRPMFGALSDLDPDAIENFFGWEQNEIAGQKFFEDHCVPTPHPRNCTICGQLRNDSNMKDIVRVPITMLSGGRNDATIKQFIAMNNRSRTVFAIESATCANSPAFSDFSLSRPWFFWKYWDQRTLKLSAGDVNVSSNSPSFLNFSDKEISIAVHVRRGDFFDQKKRKLMNCKTYAKIIRTVQAAIEERGDKLSKMPVAVYIFSEGMPMPGYGFGTHDMRHLTEDFLDEDRVVRDATWWTRLLAETSSQPRDKTSAPRAQPKIPRVELRISRPTLLSTHQMIAADVFIGSMSGLSANLVRTLSRGVQIHPGISPPFNFCCAVTANEDTGVVDQLMFRSLWSDYAASIERFLP